ncbi:cation:proton antiporter [Tsukamurella sp. PLM1]|uniref:cation:proton antiporter domain-containing protein n=1 Tax=Tsukamurella sp. PLM1 TaxID=2929795 RepID=UPI00205F95D4|nr:cation:proton antiporter [Tsukamurella sp. PLM1]BDH56613.1 hypothetical protein MTP03_15520 [Tsukamurella sp. PLM1]
MARSLLIGLPVGLALSLFFGWLLLPHLGWPVLLLIACVIAPIDFASAPALLRDRRVPARVRDILTVESGYTDGLVTPVFLFALYWAGPGARGTTPRPRCSPPPRRPRSRSRSVRFSVSRSPPPSVTANAPASSPTVPCGSSCSRHRS